MADVFIKKEVEEEEDDDECTIIEDIALTDSSSSSSQGNTSLQSNNLTNTFTKVKEEQTDSKDPLHNSKNRLYNSKDPLHNSKDPLLYYNKQTSIERVYVKEENNSEDIKQKGITDNKPKANHRSIDNVFDSGEKLRPAVAASTSLRFIRKEKESRPLKQLTAVVKTEGKDSSCVTC